MLAALRAALRAGALGLRPDAAAVLHRPRYFSSRRNSDIEFDVAVELTPRLVGAPTLYWIWECKSSRRLVSVDEVEEFWSKLEQVGSANTKGTIASPTGFQRGSLEFARSVGLGLARFVPGHEMNHLAHSVIHSLGLLNPTPDVLLAFLTQARVRPPTVFFASAHDGRLQSSLDQLRRTVAVLRDDQPRDSR